MDLVDDLFVADMEDIEVGRVCGSDTDGLALGEGALVVGNGQGEKFGRSVSRHANADAPTRLGGAIDRGVLGGNDAAGPALEVVGNAGAPVFGRGGRFDFGGELAVHEAVQRDDGRRGEAGTPEGGVVRWGESGKNGEAEKLKS